MKKTTAKNVASYRAAHDPAVIVPTKIRAALAAMLKEGPEQWEYESDFIRRAGIAGLQMPQYRDKFADHIVEAPGAHGKTPRRVWFANAKVAAKVRNQE